MARGRKRTTTSGSGAGAVSCVYGCGASFNTAAAMEAHRGHCPNQSKTPDPKFTKRPKDDE